ncbi:MAG: hypothetical protein E6Q06_02135 [Candidatus Moraniibacteriota bacterium]|nr:MAG: hypothetical protein E6Q06_02135 [Candidatus Moranbacteria bacterium]
MVQNTPPGNTGEVQQAKNTGETSPPPPSGKKTMLAVGKIQDLVENAIRTVLEQQLVNAIIRQIVVVLAIVLIAICFVLIFVCFLNSKSQLILPKQIRATWFWRKISSLPLLYLTLIVLALLPALYLSPLTEAAPNYILVALGLALCFYSLMKIKTCQRYFLLVAGLIFLLLGLVRLGFLGFDSVWDSGLVFTLLRWSQAISIVFIVFDHFMYLPTCRQSAATGDEPPDDVTFQ